MISFVLPTRNRPQRLAQTLRAIRAVSDAEIIVADNASDPPAAAGRALGVQVIRLKRNAGAAARNAAAQRASGEWVVMLDDDSYPLDAGFVDALREAPADVAAVGADIRLPDGAREAGGLPEVFVGCGAAVRRAAFCEAGGYDEAFHYYAEEYDLCARLIAAGHRVVHDPRFRVRHEKVDDGRDMDVILHRLVRNNGWIVARYAPPALRDALLRREIVRYGGIAAKESAQSGYRAGLHELFATLHEQPRRPLAAAQFDRFCGLAAARAALGAGPPAGTVALVDQGRNAWVVRRALEELGALIVAGEESADALVIATMSPGPMLDACERRAARGQRVMTAWDVYSSARYFSASARLRSAASSRGSTARARR